MKGLEDFLLNSTDTSCRKDNGDPKETAAGVCLNNLSGASVGESHDRNSCQSEAETGNDVIIFKKLVFSLVT